MNSLNSLSMFLGVIRSSFAASGKPIEQKLASFDSNYKRISDLIKSIGETHLCTAWNTIAEKVNTIKAGSREDTAADMKFVESCLSEVVASVKTLQNKALEKVATPMDSKKVDYWFFLDKEVLSSIRDAYAKKSLSASIEWPNTCEAFSQLASHILGGDYGSEIRERLVGDFFEQGQMLLLLLVDQLQNRADLTSVEIFQGISKEEAACLAAMAKELKEVIMPYLTSDREIELPEHKLMMGLLSRIRFKNEGEFRGVTEYYRALYSPTIGQLLHLATSSKNPKLVESLQGTTLSKQKLALFSKALEIVTHPDLEQTKLLLAQFLNPYDSGFAERLAVAAELLAIMAGSRPLLALTLAHRIFERDEIELANVAAGILAHAAVQDVGAALELAKFLLLKSRALTEASRFLAKRYPTQALLLASSLEGVPKELAQLYSLVCREHSADMLLELMPLVPHAQQPLFLLTIVATARGIESELPRVLDLIDTIQEPELLEKAIDDVFGNLPTLSSLSEDRIDALLQCAEKLSPHVYGVLRINLASICLEEHLPQRAWKIANLIQGGFEETRIGQMCQALTSIAGADIQEAIALRACARNTRTQDDDRLDHVLRLSLLEQMKNRPIEDIFAMLPEIPKAYREMFLAGAIICADKGDIDANLRALEPHVFGNHISSEEVAYQSGMKLDRDALKALLEYFNPATHDLIRMGFLRGVYAAKAKMTVEEMTVEEECNILDGIQYNIFLETMLRFLYTHKDFCLATEAEVKRHLAYIDRCIPSSRDWLSCKLVSKISISFPDLAEKIAQAINDPELRQLALPRLSHLPSSGFTAQELSNIFFALGKIGDSIEDFTPFLTALQEAMDNPSSPPESSARSED